MEEKTTLQIKKKHMIIVAIALLIVVVASFFVFNSRKNSITGDSIRSGENLRIAELSLPGMFCAGCAYSSQTSLENMDGVISADVNIDTKKGTVVYNPEIISKEQLVQDALIQAYDGRIISDEKYKG